MYPPCRISDVPLGCGGHQPSHLAAGVGAHAGAPVPSFAVDRAMLLPEHHSRAMSQPGSNPAEPRDGVPDEYARLWARLRESEQKYRSMFENAVEGIFQTTPEGRYLTANPALA